MPKPAWETVSPLVANQNSQGGSIAVVFECPFTGEKVAAQAALRRVATAGTANVAGAYAKHTARREVMGWMNRMLGGGLASQAARRAMTSTSAGRPARPQGHRPADKAKQDQYLRDAVVDAFLSVQDAFKWDTASSRWVHVSYTGQAAAPARTPSAPSRPGGPGPQRTTPPPPPELELDDDDKLEDDDEDAQSIFEAEAVGAPELTTPERSIMARMIAAVVMADGEIHDEERETWSLLADAGLPDLDAILRAPPLRDAELAATRKAIRPQLLRLTLAVALSDSDFDIKEQELIHGWARIMGLAPSEMEALEAGARGFIVDRMLTRAYEGRRIDNIALAQARETANRLGVPPSEFQALERGYRNRLIGR